MNDRTAKVVRSAVSNDGCKSLTLRRLTLDDARTDFKVTLTVCKAEGLPVHEYYHTGDPGEAERCFEHWLAELSKKSWWSGEERKPKEHRTPNDYKVLNRAAQRMFESGMTVAEIARITELDYSNLLLKSKGWRKP